MIFNKHKNLNLNLSHKKKEGKFLLRKIKKGKMERPKQKKKRSRVGLSQKGRVEVKKCECRGTQKTPEAQTSPLSPRQLLFVANRRAQNSSAFIYINCPYPSASSQKSPRKCSYKVEFHSSFIASCKYQFTFLASIFNGGCSNG